MSRFFSEKFASLTPYTPGEQPKERTFIKLNTNESPFPPSPRAIEAAADAAARLQLYPDPECTRLTEKVAAACGVKAENVLLANGSDEILDFAFMAFCDSEHPVAFADVTYGFYPVVASLHGIAYEEIPLQSDFSVGIDDYIGIGKTVVIANPNAPTGIALSRSEIETIVRSNPDNVVIVDEAYVDFGAESCVPLIHKYDNLLIVQTFSKSRSMAGARLGFAVGAKPLIDDLHTLKYSINPYNVNAMTLAAGLATLEDSEYTAENCRTIKENREYAAAQLKDLGFDVLPSKANFLFARHRTVGGEEIYTKLREEGILVRHFAKERISDFNRITIGTREQTNALIRALKKIVTKGE